MHKVQVAVIAFLFSHGAVAEESKAGGAIETETFKMQLPPGWNETKREPKILYLGTGKQTAEISIARITGEGTAEEKERARLKLKANLRKAVVSNSENADYLIAQNVQEKQVANGNTVIYTKLRTRDKQSYVHQYGVLGPSAGLLITVEGPVSELFTANIFEYYVLTSVQWK